MSEYGVKVRLRGQKRFLFVTSRGGLNPLRIHAARFRDKQTAEKTIEMNKDPSNPGWEWKAVPL